MSAALTHALTRRPGPNFAQGLTSATAGPPDLDLALSQHAAYCDALRACGLAVTTLPADPDHADSTFVEDTAVVTADAAVATRPGAPSRAGEVARIEPHLHGLRRVVHRIVDPGTLDGGDVCEAGAHYFIGVSARTNLEGANQLRSILQRAGYGVSTVDIRGHRSLLHLKSGLAYLGDARLLVAPGLPEVEAMRDYQRIEVEVADSYAANCVRINDRVLIAAGYPRLRATLCDLGYSPIELAMSEFRKMDGGLSCLSLRF